MALALVAAPTAASARKPPPVFLRSAAGMQVAVQGSYCIDGPGLGICADAIDPQPRRLTVVRRGDTVSFEVPDTTALTHSGCSPSPCRSVVTVHRLGCTKPLRTIRLLTSPTRWRVDLPRGRYELDTFVFFRTARSTGDTSGSLGLWVAPRRPRAIVDAPRRLPACS